MDKIALKEAFKKMLKNTKSIPTKYHRNKMINHLAKDEKAQKATMA